MDLRPYQRVSALNHDVAMSQNAGREVALNQATDADPFGEAAQAAAALCDVTGKRGHDIAVVLGSGWAAAADRIGSAETTVELSSLPGFPEPTVAGHRGQLRSLTVAGTSVVVFGGRSHLYEGHSPATVVHAVRTAAAAGCTKIILTNAAGSLRTDWPVGQIVALEDHLNMTGASPMVGAPPPEQYPPRFCDLTAAYSPRLRAVAARVDPDVATGVYAGLLGGNYETPAEIAMLAKLGADLVGMSTVLETIAARHLGMEVLGLSLVTNPAAGLGADLLDHADVLSAAGDAQSRIVDLISGVIVSESEA